MTVVPQFIIVCREAFLQEGTNNLNLIGIFTHLNAAALPFVYPRFAIVVNFDIDVSGEHILQADIRDPNNVLVTHAELPVRTTSGNWQIIANFEQVKFTAYGAYSFHASLDGVALGSRRIQLQPNAISGNGRGPHLA